MKVVNLPPRRRQPDPTFPRQFLSSTDFTAAHKIVICELLSRQGTANYFRASYGQIAKEVGLSRRHVMRIIEDLTSRREVRVTKHGVREVQSFSLRFANNRNRRRKEWLTEEAQNGQTA